ncbi:MAG TPA: hypothetical protein DIC48_06760 [Leuconostoc pseudomesenteroides]|nr:hypothetical protein [Leuconostoc pseudomesenteroides]
MEDRILTIIGFVLVIAYFPVVVVLRVSWLIYGLILVMCDKFIKKEQTINFISFEDYLWIFQ